MAEWNTESIESLTKLYVETDIPSDTLVADKEKLAEFTSTLNQKSSVDCNYTDEEVAHKLLNLRKAGNLPTIRS